MKIVVKEGPIDNLIYSYMTLRLLFYVVFFVLNSFQSWLEFKKLRRIRNKNKVQTTHSTITTRFYIFLSNSFFCLFRIISTALFYWRPNDYKIGTVVFLFFSLGTLSIFVCWICILQYWLILMYSFFVSKEIGFNKIKPINITIVIFIIIILIWMVLTSVLGIVIEESLTKAQAYGFIILLLVYSVIVIIFGSIFLKSLKNHKKSSSMLTSSNKPTDETPVTPASNSMDSELFIQMIYKTKVLLITVITMFLSSLITEVIYQFIVPITTSSNIQMNFIIMVIDGSQLILVMYILSNGHFLNYFLFKEVKTNVGFKSQASGGTTEYSAQVSQQLQQPQNSQLSIEMSDSNNNNDV